MNSPTVPPVNDAPASDLAELHALNRGDETALNRLIERWEKRLFAFAWRYVRNTADAEDLVASVFVRLYQHRTRLRPDTNLSAWFFTTLSNLCRNHHRWRTRHPTANIETENEGDAPIDANSPLPLEVLEKAEQLDALTGAIDKLPKDLKITLLLHHYEKLSYREIAAITGVSAGAVDTRLCRARAQLRDALGVVR